jgi:hypothetical protein
VKRQLREDKLLETIERVRRRIAARFPDSGLAEVAAEVVQITREALDRAAAIRRPNWWLRAGLGVLAAIAAGGVATYAQTRADGRSLGQAALHFLDEAKGSAAVLTAAAVFLVTLETRVKRGRALRAVHELRAVAHIIDMHHLTKDPDRLGDPASPLEVAGRPMDADAMGRYLHFGIELLAVVGKVGQLYVQDFPDPPSQAAVDQFENLATGLSSKVWQKLMILDRVRAAVGAAPSPALVEPDHRRIDQLVRVLPEIVYPDLPANLVKLPWLVEEGGKELEFDSTAHAHPP